MKYDYMVIVVQCRETGRFLLKKVGDDWIWPSVMEYDFEKAMLHQSLLTTQQLMGIEELPSDSIIDYIVTPEKSKLMVFHVWISEEISAVDYVGWFSLFDFPEPCDRIVDKVLRLKAMKKASVTPIA